MTDSIKLQSDIIDSASDIKHIFAGTLLQLRSVGKVNFETDAMREEIANRTLQIVRLMFTNRTLIDQTTLCDAGLVLVRLHTIGYLSVIDIENLLMDLGKKIRPLPPEAQEVYFSYLNDLVLQMYETADIDDELKVFLYNWLDARSLIGPQGDLRSET